MNISLFDRTSAAGETVLSRSQMEQLAKQPMPQRPHGNVTLVMTPFGAVPNRLKGAYINDEGDAV